jgi:HTH-type transcriptional regulator, competence development regulator
MSTINMSTINMSTINMSTINMSTINMSTETIGKKLRILREEKKLTLRRVAALIDIDVAILSKMERGERKLSKKIILKLAEIYKYNSDELLVLFLSDKILYEIQNEELGEKALRVAEERVKYINSDKKIV